MTAIQAVQTKAQEITAIYNKPDNPKWKVWGNRAVIFAAPIGALAILIFVPAPFKDPAAATWAVLMGAFKGLTKLTTDPNPPKTTT